jgi:acyl-CoA thioester hydrolase
MNKTIDLDSFNFHTMIPLRWKDIDQFGHVNNSNYLTFFEVARFYYCKEVNEWDWNLNQFIIAQAEVEYLRPLFFPNDIKVYLKVADIGTKSFAFYYVITFLKNGVEKIAATGKTTQVMYDVKQQKTIEIPTDILEQWRKFEEIS